MPAELERWSSETLWDENPPTLLTGFLVVSRETDHGRKGIDWKGIHLLVPLLGRLENQAFETGRTGSSSNIWSQPKSSRKSIHWDCPHCWTRGPCLAQLPLSLNTDTVPGNTIDCCCCSHPLSEWTPHCLYFFASVPTAWFQGWGRWTRPSLGPLDLWQASVQYFPFQ